jgi:hypothetical protein
LLRRFLLHLLPRGFVRIRNFGFLANRQRARLLPLWFSLLRGSEAISAAAASPAADRPHSSWNCPVCGATMHVLERLSAAQLLLRLATRLPSPAKVHAAMVEPVPPPRMRRSKSSTCDSLASGTDQEFFVLFISIPLETVLYRHRSRTSPAGSLSNRGRRPDEFYVLMRFLLSKPELRFWLASTS